MNDQIASVLLTDVRREFANQRKVAERAVAQLNEDELFRTIGEDGNSVAILMKHIGGNLRSRWTDFLTADGEKPDRNRDGEFVADGESADSVRRVWEAGWGILDQTLASLRPEDLLATVRIRGEELSAIKALNRGLAHIAQHVGQIILIAKVLRAAEWQTLSIPRGKSADFASKLPT